MEKSGKWIFGIGVSAIALVVAFWGVRPERILEALSGAKYFYLIPAILVIFLGLVARARSWQILLGFRVPLRRVFYALNEGYLLNSVLPLRLGELGRAYLVSQDLQISAGHVLASVVVERIIDTLISFLGLMLALPFLISPSWTQSLVRVVGAILVLIALTLALLLTQRQRLIRLLSRLPGTGYWGLDHAADEFIKGLELLLNTGRLLRATFWSLIAWGTAWLQIWLLLRMFGVSGSIVISLFVSGVIAFGAALPSSPGAVGVYELSAIAGLMVFNLPREIALSFAVVAHILQIALTGGLGAWALAREGQTLMGLAAKTQTFIRKLQKRPV